MAADTRNRQRPTLALLFVLALLIPASSASAQHTVPKALPELVAEADWVVVATLRSAQARWSATRTLIVTDYRFDVEQPLFGDLPAGWLVLSQGGGELDGEGHALSSNPELQIGGRYLLFVSPERGEIFSPFVSGGFGVVRLGADGQAVSLGGADRWQTDELLTQVGRLIVERGDAPTVVPMPARGPEEPYPEKTYVPLPKPLADRARAPVPEADSVGNRSDAPAPSEADDPAMPASDGHGHPSRYVYPRTANFPVVFDEFPHHWSWSPSDQYELARWNHYAGNLFLVSGATLDTWAWGNGRFELVGWPTNATMIAQFGEGWGANTLAVCWTRWNASNVIIEADVALNPAFAWTLDARTGAIPSPAGTVWHFGQTMLHEVGHAWGLAHPWETQDVWWDSVMNYAPKQWRRNRLNTDDTNAVRSRYGGPVRTDGLLSLYRTSDTAGNNNPTYTDMLPSSTTVYHGQSLSLGALQIENTGTTQLTNPRVDLYLTQNWQSWTNTYVLLRTLNYNHTLPTFYTMTGNVGATVMPGSMPTGRYYLTGYLNLADSVGANNTISAQPNARVTVRNNAPTLNAIEPWRTTTLGRVGPEGEWRFLLPTTAGRTYELSLCPGSGGSGNFDTVIEVVGGGSNDDHCGLQSRLLFVAPSTGTRTVLVRGFAGTSQGQFILAYRQVVVDRIFGHGFQN